MPEQETGEFQFQMDMDTWTQTPSATPSSSKIEMLIFGLQSKQKMLTKTQKNEKGPLSH